MIEPIDVWRSAKIMVDKHGAQAPLECALKADAFLDEGDPDGQLAWLAIRRAAVALLESKPADSHGHPPAGYPGPYRVWGPSLDERVVSGPGEHKWIWEITPDVDGPFTMVRPHAFEWWNGEAWIGTD